MKTLADFKRRLAANKGKTIRLVSNTVARKEVEPEDRRIEKVQGNSFSMFSPRFGREIWMNFYKAKEWSFGGNQAIWTRQAMPWNDGPGIIVFEFPADSA